MNPSAFIFDMQTLSTHDGPGIRTTVFLKGCPLRCTWCCNPEGQNAFSELRFRQSRCKGCFACVFVCTGKHISITEKEGSTFPVFDRAGCQVCTAKSCVEACPYEAVDFAGYPITVEEFMNSIKKDIRLFRNSGGGITFSGGEPLIYPDFIRSTAQKLKSYGISTAVETCGFWDMEKVEDIYDSIDVIYFDIKTIDDEKHRQFTGRSNLLILENLTLLAEKHRDKITVSIPVIPFVNDTEEEIEAICEFLRKNGINKFRLLPYHNMGIAKYDSLGRAYPHEQFERKIEPEFIEKMKSLLK
jgi:pyruvate formate lyase activating enzyme